MASMIPNNQNSYKTVVVDLFSQLSAECQLNVTVLENVHVGKFQAINRCVLYLADVDVYFYPGLTIHASSSLCGPTTHELESAECGRN